jgi:translation initiation factor eIF-2B subunit alpha
MLITSGNFVVDKASSQKQKLVQNAQDFIRDGHTLLVHSYSRVIMLLLLEAARANKRFSVYVTESRPSNSGYKVMDELKAHDIPVTLILDSAVGYIMEKVDMVLVGAEGVVENGGLINQVRVLLDFLIDNLLR